MQVGPVARAENIGSLLRSDALLTARRQYDQGKLSAEQLLALEDAEVLGAIRLQESAGLDVITDGELRRPSWTDTYRHMTGLEPRPNAIRSYPANPKRADAPNAAMTVVSKIGSKREGVGGEYGFLHDHTTSRTKYTTSRTKYTIAAPSYHRRYWSDEVSPVESPYATCEEYLLDVRDWIREICRSLAARDCTYIQLDAPNYGSLCDPVSREFHVEQGHDLKKELAFDAALDSSTFDGLSITGALHICRGNPGGGRMPHSSGGYGAIAEDAFPYFRIDNVLLEYDSDSCGDFAPLGMLRAGSVAVLGLLTTKTAELESEADLERRLDEAAKVKEFGELALSTQCGFSSAANAPMTVEEQQAKLRLVVSITQRVWA